MIKDRNWDLKNSQYKGISDKRIKEHKEQDKTKFPCPTFGTMKKIPGTGFPVDTENINGLYKESADIDLLTILDMTHEETMVKIMEMRTILGCAEMFNQTEEGSYMPYGTSVSPFFRTRNYRMQSENYLISEFIVKLIILK